VDTVESLINPTFQSNSPSGFKVIHHGLCRNPIIFVNLFNWVRFITKEYNTETKTSDLWRQQMFLHCIPFGDVIYQDDSINSIIYLSQKYQQTRRFDVDSTYGDSCGPSLLFRRATCILSHTGNFYPNINPTWGKVFSIRSITDNKEIIELDSRVRKLALKGDIPIKYHDRLKIFKWYEDLTNQARKQSKIDKEIETELGKRTEKLYRFLI
jgi:hypothetical protein